MVKNPITNKVKNQVFNYFRQKHDMDKAIGLTNKYVENDLSIFTKGELDELHEFLKPKKPPIGKISIEHAKHKVVLKEGEKKCITNNK